MLNGDIGDINTGDRLINLPSGVLEIRTEVDLLLSLSMLKPGMTLILPNQDLLNLAQEMVKDSPFPVENITFGLDSDQQQLGQ